MDQTRPMAGRPVAVVTGASSGVGREFAFRLAQRGHSLVLIARRGDRLDDLAAELAATYGVDAQPLVADLTDPTAPTQIADALRQAGLTAQVLINAAGFATAGPLRDEDPDGIAREIAVNVSALTVLTRLLLPDLTSQPGGLLVNVSSTAAFQPLPGAAVYAATKAYVSSFTSAVWAETAHTGLRVLSLCPGPTDTEFFGSPGTQVFQLGRLATVAEVVDEAFAAIDGGNAPQVVAGWRNRIQAQVARLSPLRWSTVVGGALLRRAGARGGQQSAR